MAAAAPAWPAPTMATSAMTSDMVDTRQIRFDSWIGLNYEAARLHVLRPYRCMGDLHDVRGCRRADTGAAQDQPWCFVRICNTRAILWHDARPSQRSGLDALDHPGDTGDGFLPVPEGWAEVERGGPFTRLIGPVYVSHKVLETGEPARFGFRVRREHCNPRLVCHGGMLASVLDIVLACSIRETLAGIGSIPTVSMTLDYLAPAPLGDWVESRASVLRLTRGHAFVQALLVGAGGPVLRGSGIYKITAPDPNESRT